MRSSSILRVLGVLAASAVLFLALAEIGLRAYLARHVIYDVEMSRYAQLLKVPAEDPVIGHVHRPHARAHLMGVDVAINSDGLRDGEHALERDRRRRIVFLGDSLTFGWGVEQRDTFARLLEARLGERQPTEVLNFGTGNYNTAQEVALLRKKGLAYRPDAVVVFYFINDAEPSPTKSRLAFLANLRVSTFYWSRIRQLLSRIVPAESFADYYAGLYRDDRPGWQQTQRAFLELIELCHERGIVLKVVLLPELHDLVSYPFTREHEKVARFLRDHGVEVLDLAPLFRDQTDPQSLWVSVDDAHPNAQAHRLIAERSFEFLAMAYPLAREATYVRLEGGARLHRRRGRWRACAAPLRSSGPAFCLMLSEGALLRLRCAAHARRCPRGTSQARLTCAGALERRRGRCALASSRR